MSMIRTAFKLPFRALHPTTKFFASGGDVQLALEFATEPTLAQVKQADYLMQLFTDYAGTGALSGRRFEPHQSGVDRGPIAFRSPKVRVLSLSHCRVDDTAIVLLCDMLMRLHLSVPLHSFIVSNGGEVVELLQDPHTWSTYPERYIPLPFEINDQQPESGAYTFVLDLVEPLQAPARDSLNAWLSLWTRCVLAGCYALAPIEPKGNYVEPDGEVVDFATTVEWSVFKLRADPVAIDALINLLCCFSERFQRVVRVTIQ